MWQRREEEGMMNGLFQDARLAVRRLARTPVFTVVTVSALAVGVGANTALFSALHAALLSRPPYPDIDRIVLVDLLLQSRAGVPADTMQWSYPKFEHGRGQLESLEAVAAYGPGTLTLTGAGPAARVSVEYVTPAYFDILGASPATGRLLSPAEEAPATAPVALLSHALWAARFGGDESMIGASITVDGVSLEVVGVLSEGFRGVTGRADLWVPVAGIPTISGPRRLELAWAHWLRVIGRLRPDVTLAMAREEARTVGASITEAYPDPDGGGAHDVAVVPLIDARVNPIARTAVTAVSASALLFLLIACGSVASLLLARASTRSIEVAIRVALGAGRSRLVREHLLESMILAGAGGALGLALAVGGQSVVAAAVRYALDTSGGRDLQYLDPASFHVGGGTLALGLGVALGTGLIFGLVPAWAASRTSPGESLRARSGVGGHGGPRPRDAGRTALVFVQLALTLVLLVGSGLMGASFARLAQVDLGFTNTNVIALSYDRGPGGTEQESHLFVSEALRRIGALPQIVSVAAVTCPPLVGRCEIVGLRQIDDQQPRSYSEMEAVLAYAVTDGYFETIGAALVAGRGFQPSDADGPPVVLVNEAAAALHFPGTPAVGHRLSITHALTETELATVVGVVGDVRYAGLEEPPLPAVYLSEHQAAMPYGALLVHTSDDPYAVLDAVRREVQGIDPQLPLFNVSTLAEARALETARTRIILGLLLAFALSGLLIGALGLYGIVSHAVSRRTAEVGLRIALGADRFGVLAMMFKRPAAIALASALVGLAAASAGTRYLETLLYGTTTAEPLVLIAATTLLGAVACGAAWIPAHRATRVDPVTALRNE
jgi:putative ABC transport system permease protein